MWLEELSEPAVEVEEFVCEGTVGTNKGPYDNSSREEACL